MHGPILKAISTFWVAAENGREDSNMLGLWTKFCLFINPDSVKNRLTDLVERGDSETLNDYMQGNIEKINYIEFFRSTQYLGLIGRSFQKQNVACARVLFHYGPKIPLNFNSFGHASWSDRKTKIYPLREVISAGCRGGLRLLQENGTRLGSKFFHYLWDNYPLDVFEWVLCEEKFDTDEKMEIFLIAINKESSDMDKFKDIYSVLSFNCPEINLNGEYEQKTLLLHTLDAQTDSLKKAKYLLEQGLDLNYESENGERFVNSLLDILAKTMEPLYPRRNEDVLKVFTLCIAHGVDPDILLPLRHIPEVRRFLEKLEQERANETRSEPIHFHYDKETNDKIERMLTEQQDEIEKLKAEQFERQNSTIQVPYDPSALQRMLTEQKEIIDQQSQEIKKLKEAEKCSIG